MAIASLISEYGVTFFLIVLSVLAVNSRSSVVAQEGTPRQQWIGIGPVNAAHVSVVAIDPTWPQQQFLLAALASDAWGKSVTGLARSRDGGASWDTVTSPVANVDRLTIGSTANGGRVIFLGAGPKYRSRDDGDTWEMALSTPPSEPTVRLILSPSFSLDHTVFVVTSGSVYRSTDDGASWERMEPAAGQRIQSAAISPMFATDQTVFVATMSVDYAPWNTYPTGMPAEEVMAHEQSSGILRSRDAGATWESVTIGLEVEGKPYRRVANLTISPTFATDHTLFAFALGPYERSLAGSEPATGLRAALFMSQDGGNTWRPSYEPSWRPTGNGMTHVPHYRTHVVLSPTFASDGVALLTETATSPGSRGGSCTLRRTADGGASWTAVAYPSDIAGGGTYGVGCGVPLMNALSSGQSLAYMVLRYHEDGYPIRSQDGGRTWEQLSRPGRLTLYQTQEAAELASDGTIFLGGRAGLWILRPD